MRNFVGKTLLVGMMFLALLGVSLGSAEAADWPEPGKTMTFVVNMDPGQAHDLMARSIAPYLAKYLGVNVVVENIPGGGQVIGTRNVLNRPADGYTLLTWSYPKLDIETEVTADGSDPFYALDDFATIGSIMPEEHMLFVKADSPFNTLQDIIDYAKQHPGELTFASSNNYPGIVGYIWDELQEKTGTEFGFVPYNGAQPVIVAIMGGHNDISSLGVGDIYELYVKTGKLKAIAMVRKRSPIAPDVPTIAEAIGIEWPDYLGLANRSTVIRGDTDPAIIEIIRKAFKQAAEDPEFIEQYSKTGYIPVYQTAEELEPYRRSIAQVAKEKKLAAEQKQQ